jgi:hypothetical protein
MQISNLIKIRPVEAELFHADGRTDRQRDTTKQTVAFRKFTNAPKNMSQYHFVHHISHADCNGVEPGV